MSRKVVVILLVIAAAGAVAGYLAAGSIQSNIEQLTLSTIPDVDLSALRDGTYTGTYAVFPVSARVEVTVKNHRITHIDLVQHRHGRGAEAEVIPDRVLERQTLSVDSISGATCSSKVILNAIRDALLQAAE